MKSCVCGKQALYFCRSCLLSICKEHKITYEKENQSSHIFDKLQKLTLRQISKITESLTSKINKASECEQQIIDKTESLLAEIQRMCMQAIDIIKEKKQKYARIYSDFCRANDAIRKNLLKEIKEYKADANVILRYNLKKIMELRKEANGCENDIYHAKLREYNLKLEIDSLDIEIENLKQKVLELELQQRENKKKHQEEMSFLAMESDRFLQENRCFVDINSSLLFEAEKLLENL